MQRRVFSREFKLEAMKLVTGRGVAALKKSRDLDVAESVLRRRMREASAEAQHAFPGHGLVRPERQETADAPESCCDWQAKAKEPTACNGSRRRRSW